MTVGISHTSAPSPKRAPSQNRVLALWNTAALLTQTVSATIKVKIIVWLSYHPPENFSAYIARLPVNLI